MKDQFGKSIQSSNFQNKALILVGCLPEDESICRKVGRKIYWKIQTYAYGKEDQISAIGYLMLKDTNKEVAQSLIPKFQSSGYESVYLDWNGDLKKGIRSGKVYVRGYNSKGSLIVNEYWTEANNNSVKELYNRVLPESTKN